MVELFRGSSQEIVSETEQELRSVESLCLFSSFLFMFSAMAYLFTSGAMALGIPSRTGVEAYREEKA